jgi:hypothetical protein
MYYHDEWTKAQREHVIATMAGHYQYTVGAALHPLDDDGLTAGVPIPAIIDGQINGGGRSPVYALTVLDHDRTLRQVEGINAAQHLMRIGMSVLTPTYGWLTFPLHVGNVDICNRDGDQVTLSGRNKSALLQFQVAEPFVIPAGTRITEAIRLVAIAGGEVRGNMAIPDRPQELHEDYPVRRINFAGFAKPTVSIDRDDEDRTPITVWWMMQDLASNLDDFMLYYNQGGKLIGRRIPVVPAYTFEGYTDGSYLTPPGPALSADFTDFHNVVEVYYRSAGTPPVIEAFDPSHRLSARSLAWHGVVRPRVLSVLNYKIKAKRTAVARAHDLLEAEAQHVVNVTAACKRFPWMEWRDVYQFNSTDYTNATTVNTWTMDLAPGVDMTLGWSDYRTRGI